MEITEWFDINKIEHVKAWQVWAKTGVWPKDFYDKYLEGLEFDHGWQWGLAIRMAKRYAEFACDGKIFGIPGIDQLGE